MSLLTVFDQMRATELKSQINDIPAPNNSMSVTEINSYIDKLQVIIAKAYTLLPYGLSVMSDATEKRKLYESALSSVQQMQQEVPAGAGSLDNISNTPMVDKGIGNAPISSTANNINGDVGNKGAVQQAATSFTENVSSKPWLKWILIGTGVLLVVGATVVIIRKNKQ